MLLAISDCDDSSSRWNYSHHHSVNGYQPASAAAAAAERDDEDDDDEEVNVSTRVRASDEMRVRSESPVLRPLPSTYS